MAIPVRFAIGASAVLALALAWPLSAQRKQLPSDADYVADVAARRARVSATLTPDTVLVLFSAPARVFSADTNYEYRQESNLLYLTGIDQPETLLVIHPSETGARWQATLCARASDPLRELWNGHTMTRDELMARSGISDVVIRADARACALDADAIVARLLASRSASTNDPAESTKPGVTLTIVDRADDESGPMDVANDHDAVDADDAGAWARAVARRHPGVTVANGRAALLQVRATKTLYEQALLRRAVEITARAHVEGMKATRPGRWEYEVKAAIEYGFHRDGAQSWAYPSIVASGPNATTLHYERATRQMRSGDLLLVDAGAEFHGLAADVTRTYPVSGRFTPSQRQIYDLVLRAQQAGIAAARPGIESAAITRAVRAVLGKGLLALGLVTDPNAATGESPQIGWWFPHSPTHGIGMDVHEPFTTLTPGTAFVVEPGLYIRQDTLDRLLADPEQASAARAVAPAVARFRDIGVRIEDSLLMMPTGPVALSALAPKTVAALETTVGGGR